MVVYDYHVPVLAFEINGTRLILAHSHSSCTQAVQQLNYHEVSTASLAFSYTLAQFNR